MGERMSEYKRLTERDEYGNADIIGLSTEKLFGELYFDEINLLTKALNKLAFLEDKIENGTLVELPCKVGDTVYWVMDMNIFTYKVKGFSYNCNDDMGLRLILQEIEPSVSFYLGKRLFFTKTEAEARLKELQEEQK